MIGLDTTGKGLGVDFNDEDFRSAELLMWALWNIDQRKLAVTVDIRYPIKYKGDQDIKMQYVKILRNQSVLRIYQTANLIMFLRIIL
jgi:hypothetical protein